VNASGLCYDRYSANGSEEWLMALGDAAAPAILFLPPLFEELNRTRALLAATMRNVAAHGYCCQLPDLPGTGESARALEECGWDDWLSAVAEAARGAVAVVSFRGGTLLDQAAGALPVWRLAPVTGASLARDLSRAGLVSQGGTAGYGLSPALRAALEAAAPGQPARVRTVRLQSDAAKADRKVQASPLWRRSEPETSSELAGLLAEDIVDWVRACGVS
jgi:alpha-beta hydrolase superfamily lysophospholipase